MDEHEGPDRDQTAPDVGGDTEMFRAFVRSGDAAPRAQAAGTSLRILTLLGGLAVLGLIVWLLLR